MSLSCMTLLFIYLSMFLQEHRTNVIKQIAVHFCWPVSYLPSKDKRIVNLVDFRMTFNQLKIVGLQTFAGQWSPSNHFLWLLRKCSVFDDFFPQLPKERRNVDSVNLVNLRMTFNSILLTVFLSTAPDFSTVRKHFCPTRLELNSFRFTVASNSVRPSL